MAPLDGGEKGGRVKRLKIIENIAARFAPDPLQRFGGRPLQGVIEGTAVVGGIQVEQHRAGAMTFGDVDELRCRIDHTTGADGQEQGGAGQRLLDGVHELRHLPEPDDVRAQGPVSPTMAAGLVGVMIAEIGMHLIAPLTPGLLNFTMHVQQ